MGLARLIGVTYVVSMGTLLGFAIVCSGVLVLRYTKPDLYRLFRIPLAHDLSLRHA